jgi:hypothetical protein
MRPIPSGTDESLLFRISADMNVKHSHVNTVLPAEANLVKVHFEGSTLFLFPVTRLALPATAAADSVILMH